jgi:peptidyl-prolyl cis-trans isomerase SurA
MHRRRSQFFCALALLFLALLAGASDVLDRIVATVNGHIILQSDWVDAQRYEAFANGLPPDRAPDDPKATLDKLIDQELLREQMGSASFPHAGDEEAAKRIAEMRVQYPDAATEQGWKAVLARYALTEEELKRRVTLELDVLRLVDSRLRPSVQIDSKTIESYYNQELLPQLRHSGAQAVPLAEVSPKIKEILTQQKMNELLVAWLQNLRSGSEIRTPAADSGGRLQ